MRPARFILFGYVSILLLSCGPAKHKGVSVSNIELAGNQHQGRILRGIYPGEEAWRWTAPTFAFSLDPPAAGESVYLELDFTVPGELLETAPAVTVSASVNGAEVARSTYSQAGRYVFASQVSAARMRNGSAEVEFTADRSFSDPGTFQLRSLIAVSVGLKQYEQTTQFREAELARARQGYEQVLKERNLRIPVEKQREFMRLFHDLPVWQNMWFHNVRILKNPLDLWMLQQIAYEVRPDFVIETGTWRGGSALYWAHSLSGMGLDSARVLTIDLQDLTKGGAASHPLWKKHVEFFQGSSTDPRIVDAVTRRVKGRRVIVNLDSNHSMTHVLEELRLYGPLVSPGSYMAVEDTHLDGIPTHPEQGPGPTSAIRRFLAEEGGKDFEQDFAREALMITSYPGGWLRRKVPR